MGSRGGSGEGALKEERKKRKRPARARGLSGRPRWRTRSSFTASSSAGGGAGSGARPDGSIMSTATGQENENGSSSLPDSASVPGTESAEVAPAAAERVPAGDAEGTVREGRVARMG